MAHCWTAVSISGMSLLQMVPLTWRTIRNCTMNNSAFCHFRGFPFCLYNSEHFLPSPFSLRRNRSWGSSLQGLPAAYHAGGIPRGLAGSPSWRHGPCACGPLCDTRPGHAHATAKLKKAFSFKMFFFFLIPDIVSGTECKMKLRGNCIIWESCSPSNLQQNIHIYV